MRRAFASGRSLIQSDSLAGVTVDEPISGDRFWYLSQGIVSILGMTNWLYKWFDPERDDPEEFVEVCESLLFGKPDSPR